MAKRFLSRLTMAAAIACSSTAALAAPPSDAQVRQLMQVFGVNKMLGQMNSQMTGVMQQQLPCVPASYWQNFVDPKGMKELTDEMIPVYQRHFTAADVDGLLKFYQSPLGKKVVTEMPATMTEGMQIGRAWGLKRGQEMMAQLQSNGTINGQGKCSASGAVQPKLGPSKSK